MAAPVAAFSGVSKTYAIYASPSARLAEIATLHRRRYHTDFRALTDVTFEIQRGEAFCIVGENGSGKSTLLQILAGVLAPTAGDVQVHGRVAALLELGAGFHPEFTGRDNVYLSAAIHGFSRREVDDARFTAIEAFAEIGAFIDQPVKTYSSGMLVRLAFAVAIHVDPDILLVDEALAVGDFYFRQRCLRKVNELRARGATIVFVSHSMGDVKAVGDRVLWLDHGRVRQLGVPDEVIVSYSAAMAAKGGRVYPAPTTAELGLLNVDHRSGDGGAEILGLGLYDDTGDALHWLNPRSRATVRVRFAARRTLVSPCAGFTMRNHLGVAFSGASTLDEGIALGPAREGEVLTVDFELQIPALYPSHFSFSPFVSQDGQMLDAVENAATLQMSPSDGVVYGYVTIPCRITVNAVNTVDAVKEPRLVERAEKAQLEFTGERVVPGQVDADLWNEHYARYLFAAKFARGERVLDLGCGTGYGSALLAETASAVTGVDVAPEAVEHARARYPRPNLRFITASCTATGLPDASFDLITAFEIIEHLEDWPKLLEEARRMLAPDGQFLVSTPNKHYYGEARVGVANPYHVHEFEFGEFEAALRAVFPSVSLFTQNHTDATVFQPLSANGAPELKMASTEAPTASAHFYFAICAVGPQTGSSAFVYVPTAANVLRERELHIAKLEGSLAGEQAAHQELLRRHDALKDELEQANRWARQAGAKVQAADAEREAAHKTLEAAHARFAADITAANARLNEAETTIEERTRWAQSLAAEKERLERALAAASASRWFALGRKLGLGPKLDS